MTACKNGIPTCASPDAAGNWCTACTLDWLKAEHKADRLIDRVIELEGRVEHYVDVASLQTEIIGHLRDAIQQARDRFAGLYRAVGNVRAWHGTAEDIDGIVDELDEALKQARPIETDGEEK